ncbi:MAG: hypothetical protein QXT31_03445 [Candidatus Bathyarchaeia archaeon]
MSVVLEKLEEKIEKRKRTFYGFKAKLIVDFPELSIECEVRYEKIDAKEITEKLQIVNENVNGTPVENKYVGLCPKCHEITPTKKVWLGSDGKIYNESEVKHFQIINGEKIEVMPFDRTKELKIIKLLPLNELDSFVIESSYEVWSDNPSLLWKFAEYLLKNDKMALTKHTFGKTFLENYALLYPYTKDGKFVIIMALTKMRKQYKHLMPINGETKEIVKKLKPISILPEI